MRRPMPGSALPTSTPLLSGECCMRLQPLARIAPRGPKMRRDGAAHFLPSRTKGEGVHAALLQLSLAFRGIARGAVAGLSAAVFIGTAVLAQAPRSVTILPDVPEAPEAAPAPYSSPLRLEPPNATGKVENRSAVSVDLIPKLEVSAGS